MLESLQCSPEDFPLEQLMLSLCKKASLSSEQPEIDFLLLEEKVFQLQKIQQKTCEQIVEFVDEHCGDYIAINQKFQSFEDSIQEVERIINELTHKIKSYSTEYYQNQSKIREVVAKYQGSILQKLVLEKCRQQTQFLAEFVMTFESIITKSMNDLTFKERHKILRFCQYFKALESLFNHSIVHQSLPEYLKIQEMLLNLLDQVQFYISEQLNKLIKYKPRHKDKEAQMNDPKVRALKQIKLCYEWLGKLPEYYKLIEQGLLGRQMQQAEKSLIAHKINLISGKNIQTVEQYFKSLFSSIDQFPKSYPRERLLELIYTQLKKSQIKFLYTYTLPIFPISYNIYIKFVEQLQNQNQTHLLSTLKNNHNWDLKRWLDVRQKNILDRSWKDWEKTQSQKQFKNADLVKWIDIVLKENCKIQGIKTEILRLAVKVVGKYAQFIENSEFTQHRLHNFVEMYYKLNTTLKEKTMFFFSNNKDSKQNIQNKDSKQNIQKIAQKLTKSCRKTLKQAIQRVIEENTKLIVSSCSGSFQPYKSFIIKVIKSSKQLTQHGHINLYSQAFKPLLAYLDSFQTIVGSDKPFIKETKALIKLVVEKKVVLFYDKTYVSQIHQYVHQNLSKEQLAEVMEIVGKQRSILFQNVDS